MPFVRRDPPPAAKPQREGDGLAPLTSGSAEARFAAARALAGRKDAAQALGAALTDEADGRVREALFGSLVRTGGDEAVEVLLPYLRVEDASLRGGAIDALSAIGAVASYLPGLLSDDDPDVRLLSCELARPLPPSEATRLLCDLLDRETEANVCTAAADVLAEVGEPEAEGALQRCAARFSEEPFLIFAFKAAIARLSARG
jgi:HEAT repeat protein